MEAFIVNPRRKKRAKRSKRSRFTKNSYGYGGSGDSSPIVWQDEFSSLRVPKKKHTRKTRKTKSKVSYKKTHKKRGGTTLAKKHKKRVTFRVKGRKKHKITMYKVKKHLKRSPFAKGLLSHFPVINGLKLGSVIGSSKTLVIDSGLMVVGFVGMNYLAPLVTNIPMINKYAGSGWGKVALKGVLAIALTSVLGMVKKDIAVKVGTGAMANVVFDILTEFKVPVVPTTSIIAPVTQGRMLSAMPTNAGASRLSAMLNR